MNEMDCGADGHQVRLEKAQGELLGPVDYARGTHTKY
jgi:hypothetical protein